MIQILYGKTPTRKKLLIMARIFRARLHGASASPMWQLCNDASNSVLIQNNRVTPDLGCNPFWRNSIVCNENRITSIIAELSALTLTVGVNGPLCCFSYTKEFTHIHYLAAIINIPTVYDVQSIFWDYNYCRYGKYNTINVNFWLIVNYINKKALGMCNKTYLWLAHISHNVLTNKFIGDKNAFQ